MLLSYQGQGLMHKKCRNRVLLGNRSDVRDAGASRQCRQMQCSLPCRTWPGDSEGFVIGEWVCGVCVCMHAQISTHQSSACWEVTALCQTLGIYSSCALWRIWLVCSHNRCPASLNEFKWTSTERALWLWNAHFWCLQNVFFSSIQKVSGHCVLDSLTKIP